MSRAARVARAAFAALRAGWRPLLVAAGVGAVAGAAWGLADEPEYTATATVLRVDRGEAVREVGDGAVGAAGRGALLQLARSQDVAELAAAALGGDVGGANLLSRTEISGEGRDGVIVRSTASSPDFAAAAANAYAGALVDLAAVSERRRLKATEARLEDRSASLDPASEEALKLSDRLDRVAELRGLGAPLRLGQPAKLPGAPSSDRSVAGWALTGAAVALLLAILGIWAREARRRPLRRAEQLEAAFEGPLLAELGGVPVAPQIAAPGVLRPDPVGADRMQALLAALAVDSAEPEATAFAVLSPSPVEARTSLALGLATAAVARGLGAIVVETDMRRPSFSRRLGLDAGPGLSDYLVGSAAPREVLRTIRIAGLEALEGPGALVCITAGGDHGDPVSLLSGPRFGGLTGQLRRAYDVVIYDTPPLLSAPEAAIVGATVERGILCVRAGHTRGAEVGPAIGLLPADSWLGAVLVGGSHGGPPPRRLRPRSGAGAARRERTG